MPDTIVVVLLLLLVYTPNYVHIIHAYYIIQYETLLF